MRRYVTTITAEHVRDPRSLGKDWRQTFEALGRIMSRDIGKRIYETAPGVYQVENDAQRDARVAGPKTK